MADLKSLVKKCRASTLKMRPVLPLGQPLALGMVGFLDGEAFRYIGSVDTMLGTPPGPAQRGDSPISVDIISGKDVSVTTHGVGDTSEVFRGIAEAKARIEVTFASDKSYFLSAHDVAIQTMQDPNRLLGEMLRAYRAGLWQEEYCFIYQIGTAASLRAGLSHQSSAKLLLSASAAITAGPAPLASLGGKVGFERQSGALEQLVSNRPTRAFFNAYRVKARWFRGPTVKVASSVAPTAPAAEVTAALALKSSPFQRV